MEVLIDSTKGIPLVASALKENQTSIKLLSKFMNCYVNDKNGKYLRFVDNESYNKLYGDVLTETLVPVELGSHKSHI